MLVKKLCESHLETNYEGRIKETNFLSWKWLIEKSSSSNAFVQLTFPFNFQARNFPFSLSFLSKKSYENVVERILIKFLFLAPVFTWLSLLICVMAYSSHFFFEALIHLLLVKANVMRIHFHWERHFSGKIGKFLYRRVANRCRVNILSSPHAPLNYAKIYRYATCCASSSRFRYLSLSQLSILNSYRYSTCLSYHRHFIFSDNEHKWMMKMERFLAKWIEFSS